MKIEQLRYLVEAAARNFNFSEVARAVHRSQSVVSRQIQILEDELGFPVVLRRGTRIVGLTADGKTVLDLAKRILKDSVELKRFADERSRRGSECIAIATTHFHARYTLLAPILRFRKDWPGVHLRLRQCDPTDIARVVETEQADIGIVSEMQVPNPDIVTIPWRTVPRVLLAPAGHPLLANGPPSLRQIAAQPLIGYDEKYSGGWSVMETFRREGLAPTVVVTAMDADVIKAYVAAGLGVAVVQSTVFDEHADTGIRAVDVAHLFEPLAIVMMVKPRARPQRAVLDFAAMVIPELEPSRLAAAMQLA